MGKLIIKAIALLFLIWLGCKTDKKPIGFEEEPQEPDTTTHVFEWIADTIYAADALQIYLYDIWGTDENNVWVVGHSDDSDYQIWHWNGTEWNNINPGITGARPSYYEIFGFSRLNMWIVGSGISGDSSNGYILHYNGSWNRIDNKDLPTIAAVWSTSSRNMYFGCHFGVIAKYNGTEFIQYTTENDVHFRCIWGLNDSTIYALGNKIVYKPNVTLSIGVLYKYQNNDFVLIDSAANYDKGFGMDLWGYDENNFYSSSGEGVFKYINNQWINEFYSTTIYSVFGNAPNNVFAGGYQSTFYHYNGDNWKAINFGDELIETIWSIWCREDYAFVVQDLGYYARILHGKQINK